MIKPYLLYEEREKFERIELGHIYIVHDLERNICKIGKTTRPEKRPRGIAIASGILKFKIYISEKVVNITTAEKYTHKHFHEYRKAGEWFYLTPECVLEYIRDNIKSINKENEEYYNNEILRQKQILEQIWKYRNRRIRS